MGGRRRGGRRGGLGGSPPVGGQVVVDHQRHLLHVDACPAPPPHAPPSRRAPSRPQTGPPQPHGGGRGSIASPLLPTSACHADDRAARARAPGEDRARDRQQAPPPPPPKPGGRARTAGKQVGGDEDAGGAAAELAHDELAALLVHVAVLPPTPTTPKHTHTRHQAPTEFNAVPRRSTQTAGCVEGWDGCAGGRRSRKPARRSPHFSGFCLRSLGGRGCAPASEAESGTDFRRQGRRNERARGWRGREGLRDDAGRSQGLRPASRSGGGAGADQGRHGEVARRHLVQQEVHLPPRVDVDDGLPPAHHQKSPPVNGETAHRQQQQPPSSSQPPTNSSKQHHRPHSHPPTTADPTTHQQPQTPPPSSNTPQQPQH